MTETKPHGLLYFKTLRPEANLLYADGTLTFAYNDMTEKPFHLYYEATKQLVSGMLVYNRYLSKKDDLTSPRVTIPAAAATPLPDGRTLFVAPLEPTTTRVRKVTVPGAGRGRGGGGGGRGDGGGGGRGGGGGGRAREGREDSPTSDSSIVAVSPKRLRAAAAAPGLSYVSYDQAMLLVKDARDNEAKHAVALQTSKTNHIADMKAMYTQSATDQRDTMKRDGIFSSMQLMLAHQTTVNAQATHHTAVAAGGQSSIRIPFSTESRTFGMFDQQQQQSPWAAFSAASTAAPSAFGGLPQPQLDITASPFAQFQQQQQLQQLQHQQSQQQAPCQAAFPAAYTAAPSAFGGLPQPQLDITASHFAQFQQQQQLQQLQHQQSQQQQHKPLAHVQQQQQQVTVAAARFDPLAQPWQPPCAAPSTVCAAPPSAVRDHNTLSREQLLALLASLPQQGHPSSD